jgi:hypothetical protein
VLRKTVRKLKSEQSNAGGASLGVNQAEKKVQRKAQKERFKDLTNIFKRI